MHNLPQTDLPKPPRLSLTHRHQVLLHKRSEHVVSDGGHDVTEVQCRDAAALALVVAAEGLAGVLQLQLLRRERRVTPLTQGETRGGKRQTWRDASH